MQTTKGNGEFGTTVDPTGLQTLNQTFGYMGTLSHWGWHAEDPEKLGVNVSAYNPTYITA